MAKAKEKKILTKEEKQKRATRNLYIFVMCSFILPIGYLIVDSSPGRATH